MAARAWAAVAAQRRRRRKGNELRKKPTRTRDSIRGQPGCASFLPTQSRGFTDRSGPTKKSRGNSKIVGSLHASTCALTFLRYQRVSSRRSRVPCPRTTGNPKGSDYDFPFPHRVSTTRIATRRGVRPRGATHLAGIQFCAGYGRSRARRSACALKRLA